MQPLSSLRALRWAFGHLSAQFTPVALRYFELLGRGSCPGDPGAWSQDDRVRDGSEVLVPRLHVWRIPDEAGSVSIRRVGDAGEAKE